MLGLSLLLAGLTLVSTPSARVERAVGVMGTTFSLIVEAEPRSRALAVAEAAVLAVEGTEARLSTWNDNSELSRLNRALAGEPVALSPETASELAAAWRCGEETGGAFDPSIGPVLEAWGLRDGGRLPSPPALEAALACTGLQRLALEDGGRATWRGVVGRIEEGGFGKGAGLDRAAAAVLAIAPSSRAWMSLGGQVLLVGGGERWEIPIADPRRRGRAALALRLSSGSVSTSGNSEQGIEIDDERYGHLFDPRTGRPAPDFGSLTVVAPDGLTADCLSTGLYVLGPEAALSWAAEHPGVEVLILEPRGERLRARLTPGLAPAVSAVMPDVDVEVGAEVRP